MCMLCIPRHGPQSENNQKTLLHFYDSPNSSNWSLEGTGETDGQTINDESFEVFNVAKIASHCEVHDRVRRPTVMLHNNVRKWLTVETEVSLDVAEKLGYVDGDDWTWTGKVFQTLEAATGNELWCHTVWQPSTTLWSMVVRRHGETSSCNV